MTWTCRRCLAENDEFGDAPRRAGARDAWGNRKRSLRLVGVECECGLTRAGWLMGQTEYQYPIDGGFVKVKAGKTTVYRALPNDPNEYTQADGSEVVAEYDVERFDLSRI